jgi:hypothetical protein
VKRLLLTFLLLALPARADDQEDLFRQLVTVKRCHAEKGKIGCRFDTGHVDFTVITGENPNLPGFYVEKVEKGWRVGIIGKCLMVTTSDGHAAGAVSAWSGEVFHYDNQLADCINHG